MPNNGRLMKVTLRFLRLGSYCLGASTIPTARRAGEG